MLVAPLFQLEQKPCRRSILPKMSVCTCPTGWIFAENDFFWLLGHSPVAFPWAFVTLSCLVLLVTY